MYKLVHFVPLSLLFFVVFVLTSCASEKSEKAKKSKESFNISQNTQSKVNDFNSNLIESSTDTWQIIVTQLDKKKEISKIYFFDENKGYLSNLEEDILKTSDGGFSWETINVTKNIFAKDFFFVSSNKGYLISNMTEQPTRKASKENTLFTTEDGGRNWIKLVTLNHSSFNKIYFQTDQQGWVIGTLVRSNPTFSQSYLVLSTNDAGKTWIDVSEEMNKVAPNYNGKINDQLTDIISKNDGEVFALSLKGKIYKTSTGGKSWDLFDSLINEPPQTCICHLNRQSNGNLILAGGSKSDEGIWGMVAFQKKANEWDRFRLRGHFFTDFQFLSEKEIIAVGSTIVKGKEMGTVYYSTDGAVTWSIIYKSEVSDRLRTISRKNSTQFVIAGKKGEIILFSKK